MQVSLFDPGGRGPQWHCIRARIEWCDYTWNPVTGCRHGCSYCYARRIADRFKPQACERPEVNPLECLPRGSGLYYLDVPAQVVGPRRPQAARDAVPQRL